MHLELEESSIHLEATGKLLIPLFILECQLSVWQYFVYTNPTMFIILSQWLLEPSFWSSLHSWNNLDCL